MRLSEAEYQINCPSCGSIDVTRLKGEDYEYACLSPSCEEWFDGEGGFEFCPEDEEDLDSPFPFEPIIETEQSK
mgnify:CR=1 FL=1